MVRKPALRAPGLVSDRDGRRARRAHRSTHGQSAGSLQAGRGSRGMSSPVLTAPPSCPVQDTQRGAVEGEKREGQEERERERGTRGGDIAQKAESTGLEFRGKIHARNVLSEAMHLARA